MATSSRHVLLVSYDFPPNTGIAGRRWGYLARGMADHGWRVHVVKADPLPGGDNSAWCSVVEHPNIDVHSLPRRYPAVLTHQPWRTPDNSFLGTIQYHASLAWVGLAHRGTPYDVSLGWETVLLPRLQKILEAHPVQWIFATGAPWDVLRMIALHKSRHPERQLRLWFDFRDPWLHNQPDYGMRTLGARKLAEERAKAQVVLDHADVISAPDGSILRGFTLAGVPAGKHTQQVVLRHFHVPSDSTPRFAPPVDGSIRIVYGGSIYADASPHLEAMADDLKKLREHQPGIYARLRIDFYTDERPAIERIFSGHAHVRAVPSAGQRIFTEVAVASWCMILVPPHFKDCFTTKYYEFQTVGTPYLHVGEHGAVAQTIVAERRGLDWKSVFTLCLAGTPPDPTDFRQHASSVESLSHRVTEIEACMKLTENA